MTEFSYWIFQLFRVQKQIKYARKISVQLIWWCVSTSGMRDRSNICRNFARYLLKYAKIWFICTYRLVNSKTVCRWSLSIPTEINCKSSKRFSNVQIARWLVLFIRNAMKIHLHRSPVASTKHAEWSSQRYAISFYFHEFTKYNIQYAKEVFVDTWKYVV